jgi:hypothetical protein
VLCVAALELTRTRSPASAATEPGRCWLRRIAIEKAAPQDGSDHPAFCLCYAPFFLARTFAHLARCAAAIRRRPAADILRRRPRPFCQNYEISWLGEGCATNSDKLADMMLYLQDKGCHNINFVTPEHVVPQILEALLPALERGLRLPLVYNTSAHDSADSLALMDGIVDIYMPDFKFWDPPPRRAATRKAPTIPKLLDGRSGRCTTR